jgi:nicotinamidase/pyrazinamidase
MKVLFWDIDSQKDFMMNTEQHKGTLYIDGCESIKNNLKVLTQFYDSSLITDYAHSIIRIKTGDWHNEQTKEISDNPDFKTTFPKHCMQGTTGAEFIPETETDTNLPLKVVFDWKLSITKEEADLLFDGNKNIVIYKDTFNVFEEPSKTLAEQALEVIKPELVVVYGVCTNVCVDFAVKGLLQRGCQVIVVTDAIKELPGCNVQDYFNAWQNAGAKLMLTKDAIVEIIK